MVLVLLAVVSATGCVRRRLTVRSNPPGALVYVDNQRVGTTPCSFDYVYYGTREIRLSLPGYETLTVNQPLPTPWYEAPGLDFISENLVPTRIEDLRTVSFNLRRERLAPAEEIIARGEQLRQQVTPQGLPPTTTTVVTPAGGFPPAGPPIGGSVAPSLPPAQPTPALPASPIPSPAAGSAPPPAPGLSDTFRY